MVEKDREIRELKGQLQAMKESRKQEKENVSDAVKEGEISVLTTLMGVQKWARVVIRKVRYAGNSYALNQKVKMGENAVIDYLTEAIRGLFAARDSPPSQSWRAWPTSGERCGQNMKYRKKRDIFFPPPQCTL